MRDYLVTTFYGKKVKRSKCIRQKGKYYILNKDIVKIKSNPFDGEVKVKWMTLDDPNLVYNIDTKRYDHISRKMKYIIHDMNMTLTSNKFNCNHRECYIDGKYGLTTIDNAKANLTLDSKSGVYFKLGERKGSLTGSMFYQKLKYGYEGSQDLFKEFKETNALSKLNLLTGKYTFGVELETATGAIPSNKLLETGLIPVRDGSTPNYEFVTIPLSNVTSLFPIIEQLSKNCTFNITTAMHIHIGNVPTNKLFVSRFYKFMTNMQDEVFRMFPKYKADNELGIKRRNYTQKLPKKVKFNTILNFLNNNKECTSEYTGERLDHYADMRRTNKWYVSSRYFWVNLIPLIFYPSRTIEFRIHQGTFNKYKIIYWLLICVALIKYVEITKNSKQVALKTVLNRVYPDGNTANALYQHYLDMSSYYLGYNEQADMAYRQDERDDKTYVPSIKLF